MKPWDIIGWALIAVVVSILAVAILLALIGFFTREIRYHRSKSIPPREGQVWKDSENHKFTVKPQKWGYTIHYETVHGGFSFGVTNVEWPKWLASHRGYVLIEKNPT